jgi:hypothetical protein
VPDLDPHALVAHVVGILQGCHAPRQAGVGRIQGSRARPAR